VWDDDRVLSGTEEFFTFTASCLEDVSLDIFDLNDLDWHVSFKVAIIDGKTLKVWIRRWLPGLCDFRRVSRREVVFP